MVTLWWLALASAQDVEAAPVAEAATESEPEFVPVKRGFHGFRVGYTYLDAPDGEPPTLPSPHLFVLGYEATQRIVGGSWLNVIVVENASVAGMNQSLFVPSFNTLVGFEIDEQVQLGTGVNFSPLDPNDRYVHQILAVGWTPPVGGFNVPFHVMLLPDVEGAWRVGTTVGVNW